MKMNNTSDLYEVILSIETISIVQENEENWYRVKSLYFSIS